MCQYSHNLCTPWSLELVKANTKLTMGEINLFSPCSIGMLHIHKQLLIRSLCTSMCEPQSSLTEYSTTRQRCNKVHKARLYGVIENQFNNIVQWLNHEEYGDFNYITWQSLQSQLQVEVKYYKLQHRCQENQQ